MRLARLLLALPVLLAACGPPHGTSAADPVLPPDDAKFATFPPGATEADLLAVVEEGLATPGKGPDNVRFVVIRAGDRHGADFRPAGFHVTVGADVTMPAGALVVRRHWGTSGMVDGDNEQPEVFGVAIAVEPEAARPFGPAVTAAVKTFVRALTARVPIHPDCVVAMQEIPYARAHPADAAERALAAAARADLPLPPASGWLTIVHGEPGAEVSTRVTFERRDTTAGIAVGMMLRKRFDGTDRGMLFEYPHRSQRRFWMKNCLIPIDLAYIKEGRIEQLLTMEAGNDRPQRELSYYESNTAVKYALEMPAGWFSARGIRVGDRVTFGE